MIKDFVKLNNHVIDIMKVYHACYYESDYCWQLYIYLEDIKDPIRIHYVKLDDLLEDLSKITGDKYDK